MQLFRAVPHEKADPSTIGRGYPTRRIPSNVPFAVDNLWEYLRPAHMPSRRQAIYASPTSELALANASAVGPLRDQYRVCRLEVFQEEPGIDGEPLFRVTQLNVSDARNHGDVFVLNKLVLSVLGPGFPDLPMADRLKAAPLFLPGASREDLEAAAQSSPDIRRILDTAREISTLWQDAREPGASSDGEVFLELAAGAAYRLIPV